MLTDYSMLTNIKVATNDCRAENHQNIVERLITNHRISHVVESIHSSYESAPGPGN